MKKAKQELLDYLLEHSKDENGKVDKNIFVSNIKKFGVTRIMLEEIKEFDNPLFVETTNQMEYQKTLNEALKYELGILKNIFEKENIQFILCKGLSLASDLYNPIETRKFYDLDILINLEDLDNTLGLLNKQGFSHAASEESNFLNANSIYDSSIAVEIGALYKNTTYKNKNIRIELDLHIGLFQRKWFENVKITKQLFTRDTLFSISGLTFRQLELHDRIIHLLVHFVTDYTYDGFVKVFNGEKDFCDVFRLHDIALLIDKYKKNINWKLFIERIQAMEVANEITLALHIFERIYSKRFPSKLISKLATLTQNNYSLLPETALPLNQALPILKTTNPDILINTEFSDLIYNVIPTLGNKFRFNHVKILQLKGYLDKKALAEGIEVSANFACQYSDNNTNHPSYSLQNFKFVLLEENLSAISKQKQKHRISKVFLEFSRKKFNLDKEPFYKGILFQLTKESHVLIILISEGVIDHPMWLTFLQTLKFVYFSLTATNKRDLERLKNFSIHQNRPQELSECNINLGFWKEKYKDGFPIFQLITDKPRPSFSTYQANNFVFKISKKLSQKLSQLSNQNNVSLFITLLTSYKILLYRHTQQKKIFLGSQTSSLTEDQKINFNVSGIVPLESDVEDSYTFLEFLHLVNEQTLTAYSHNDYDYKKLVSEISDKQNVANPVPIQNLIIFHDLNWSSTASSILTFAPFHVYKTMSEYDLVLIIEKSENEIKLTFEYSSDLFESETIQLLSSHFTNLLGNIVINSKQQIATIPILTNKELTNLTVTWNDTQKVYNLKVGIIQLFEAQALLNPNATALIFEGQALSYYDLNKKANQLANHLQAEGVGPGILVGIFIERSIEMVVGLLGILKAGGAYVPLDTALPEARLKFILEDTRITVLLTQKRFSKIFVFKDLWITYLDTDWDNNFQFETENPNLLSSVNDPVYVIYTSGSTGQPKGVVITHAAITNRLLWMQEAFNLLPTSRVLQKTPYYFDVSVWEFFWPLISGACLVIAKPEGHLEASYLISLINTQHITTIHFVPSMLQLFLKELRLDQCNSIETVICSGEALPFTLQQEFLSRMKSKLYNLYGPTEAAIDVTYWDCRQTYNRQVVPIGKPISNISLFILDKNLQFVPNGVPGELHIGGIGLAKGYLNRPELTAERFIPNPIGEKDGSYLYKTGDLARYSHNGTIEYLGRIDNQVKIHGLRIELGEIESILNMHPSIQSSVVTLNEEKSGSQKLIAYLVMHREQTQLVSDIRSYLISKLPKYMIPDTFIELDNMPLTANGKLDRKNLPKPTFVKYESKNFQKPKTQIQKMLVDIWIEVLGVSEISIFDNFLDLGGNSLLSILVLVKAQNTGFQLTPAQLFEHPTIAELAECIVELD